METPQHGIGPKKNGNLPKMNFFQAFPVLTKIIGNPSNPSFRGISGFFDPFPVLKKSFKISVFDRFPLFWVRFLFFLGPFPLFWVRFWFSKKVLKSQFVDRFPLF